MIDLTRLIPINSNHWTSKVWSSKRELKTAFLVELDKLIKMCRQKEINRYSPRFKAYANHLMQEYIDVCAQYNWHTQPDLRHIHITTTLVF